MKFNDEGAIVYSSGQENLFSNWEKSKFSRKYSDIEFDPFTEDRTTTAGKGVHEQRLFNLFDGLLAPGKKGEERCPRFLKLLFHGIANGNTEIFNAILDILAYAVQNPGKKWEMTLSIIGGQGCGKTEFCAYFGKIFGRAFLYTDNKKATTGNFNKPLLGRLLVNYDEVTASDKAGDVARAKSLITNKVMTIELKGVDSFEAPNYMNLILTTNRDSVAHVEKDDRRHFIIRSSSQFTGDDEFWEEFAKERDSDGPANLCKFLLDPQNQAASQGHCQRDGDTREGG